MNTVGPTVHRMHQSETVDEMKERAKALALKQARDTQPSPPPSAAESDDEEARRDALLLQSANARLEAMSNATSSVDKASDELHAAITGGELPRDPFVPTPQVDARIGLPQNPSGDELARALHDGTRFDRGAPHDASAALADLIDDASTDADVTVLEPVGVTTHPGFKSNMSVR